MKPFHRLSTELSTPNVGYFGHEVLGQCANLLTAECQDATAHGVNCPGCGFKDSRVMESRCYDGRTVMRRRACACGGRWSTEEVVVRRTFTTTTGIPPVSQGLATGSLRVDLNPPS